MVVTKRNRRFLRAYTPVSLDIVNNNPKPPVNPPPQRDSNIAEKVVQPRLPLPDPQSLVPESSTLIPPSPPAYVAPSPPPAMSVLPPVTAPVAPKPSPSPARALGAEPTPSVSERPRRTIKPTKFYDATTGQWV